MVPLIASRRELFAWAMYDLQNSGYTTVVLTTIFNAYCRSGGGNSGGPPEVRARCSGTWP